MDWLPINMGDQVTLSEPCLVGRSPFLHMLAVSRELDECKGKKRGGRKWTKKVLLLPPSVKQQETCKHSDTITESFHRHLLKQSDNGERATTHERQFGQIV